MNGAYKDCNIGTVHKCFFILALFCVCVPSYIIGKFEEEMYTSWYGVPVGLSGYLQLEQL